MLEIRHDKIHSRRDTQSAYNEIYSQQGILLRDSFYLWLIDQLEPQRGKTLADISCGQGRLVTLAERKGLHAFGIDFAVGAVRKGQSETPQAGWVVGDGEELPFEDHSVDYVTHIGSLEHYIHPHLGAQEIARILRSGGKACVLLPNAYGLLGNIHHVWATGDIFDDGQPLQRYATRHSWESLLQDNGLRVDKVVGYNEIEFPRYFQDFLHLIKKPRKIARLAISGFIPLNLSNHLVYICSSV
jgi:SAM-dependent methyltransferase